ncbi:MAG: tyrosinase family protein, partial [Planctomycetes bacterium]|nr:tyrosinase family protein [Planctomycetota bacterium]
MQQVWIAGKQRPYFKDNDGYTLYDDAYAPPCRTLQGAVKQYEEGCPTTTPQPSGRIREDFLDLTDDQRNRLADALNQLYNSGRYPVYPDTHEAGWFNIHRGPAFLPWHRWYVLTLEEELRAIDSEITIPYWDWTRNGNQDLDAEPWKSFLGGRSNTGGKFDHWSYTRAASPGATLPSLDDIIDELQRTTFVAYRGEEFGSHVPG